jgi:tetratricopeptide (TPR) repeat protein
MQPLARLEDEPKSCAILVDLFFSVTLTVGERKTGTMTSPSYEKFRQMMDNGRFEDAADFAENQYMADNPNNPFWLTRRAAALSRLRRYSEAVVAAKDAYELDPRNPYCMVEMAVALRGLNRIEEAIPYFQAAANEKKLFAYAGKQLLYCLSVLEKWDQIEEYLDLWDFPPDIQFKWEAKVLENKGKPDEAISVCRKWLGAMPDNPQALWALTELEIKLEGMDTVLSRMEMLARIPSRPQIYREIYASLCRRAGKSDAALEQYEALCRSGSDPRILRRQAFALAKSGQEAEAIPLLEELLRSDPEDLYLDRSYTAACNRIKQLDRALGFYENLITEHPHAKTLYGRIRKLKNRLKSQ